MEWMPTTNTPTVEEQLAAIRKTGEARRRYAFIQMIAVVLLAVGMLAAVAMLLPKANAALAGMEEASAQMTAVAAQLTDVDFTGMAERLDALVIQSGADLAKITDDISVALEDLPNAIAVLEAVDLESLNSSIASLSAILEPLARFFGIFS